MEIIREALGPLSFRFLSEKVDFSDLTELLDMGASTRA